MRVLTPMLVPFALLSPLVLRPIIALLGGFISSFISLISDRSVAQGKVVQLAGRGFIWDRSMDFWKESVDEPFHILFGYGLHGHYSSGASQTYASFMSDAYRNTEKVMHMHNSSLQQLFDGGLVGWIILAIALLWTSLRLAKRVSAWGSYALAASAIMAALLWGSMTEVFLAPDMNLYTYFVMMIVVALACQELSSEEKTPDVPAAQR
jgi:O-antigen ligase